MSAARVAFFALVAVVVAVTANLVLLGIATGPKDPVGTLSPRAGLVLLPARPAAPTTTTTTTTITIPRHDDDGHDHDDTGAGRPDSDHSRRRPRRTGANHRRGRTRTTES